MRKNLFVFVLLFFVVLLIRFPLLGASIEFDSVHRLLFGEKVLNGEIPYLEVWDNLPLVVPLVWAFCHMLGDDFINYLHVLVLSVSCFMIYLYCGGSRNALLLSVFYPLVFSMKFVGNIINVNSYVVLFLLVGMYCVKKRFDMFAGFFLFLALFSKQTILFSVLLIVFYSRRKTRLFFGLLSVLVYCFLFVVTEGVVNDALFFSNLGRVGFDFSVYFVVVSLVVFLVFCNIRVLERQLVWLVVCEWFVLLMLNVWVAHYVIPLVVFVIMLFIQYLDSRKKVSIVFYVFVVGVMVCGVWLIYNEGRVYGVDNYSAIYHEEFLYNQHELVSRIIERENMTNIYVYSNDIQVYYYLGVQPRGKLISAGITGVQKINVSDDYFINVFKGYRYVLVSIDYYNRNKLDQGYVKTVDFLEGNNFSKYRVKGFIIFDIGSVKMVDVENEG